jgi:hypothetical protein
MRGLRWHAAVIVVLIAIPAVARAWTAPGSATAAAARLRADWPAIARQGPDHAVGAFDHAIQSGSCRLSATSANVVAARARARSLAARSVVIRGNVSTSIEGDAWIVTCAVPARTLVAFVAARDGKVVLVLAARD